MSSQRLLSASQTDLHPWQKELLLDINAIFFKKKSTQQYVAGYDN